MLIFFERVTLSIIISACAIALLTVLPETRDFIPVMIISSGLHIADVLFHEMGHTIFAWLFGQPTIPMIFTLFGADQAGGMSMTWPRTWLMQGVGYVALAGASYHFKENQSRLFIPTVIFSVIIVALSLTPYREIIIAYMGHGGSILMGGFLLFRAWIYLDSRNQFERWLNALFGFFVIFYNFSFSYGLAYDSDAKAVYSDHVAFGITHNDFAVIAEKIPAWSVKDIALFTMVYCVAILISSFAAAVCLRNAFDEKINCL